MGLTAIIIVGPVRDVRLLLRGLADPQAGRLTLGELLANRDGKPLSIDMRPQR